MVNMTRPKCEIYGAGRSCHVTCPRLRTAPTPERHVDIGDIPAMGILVDATARAGAEPVKQFGRRRGRVRLSILVSVGRVVLRKKSLSSLLDDLSLFACVCLGVG